MRWVPGRRKTHASNRRLNGGDAQPWVAAKKWTPEIRARVDSFPTHIYRVTQRFRSRLSIKTVKVTLLVALGLLSLPPPFHPPLPALFFVMDLNNFSANLTNITSSFTEQPSVATLATALLSVTGTRDVLKLFLIGGAFETCRRTASQAWHDFVDSIWITVNFEEGDSSYGVCSISPFTAVTPDHLL